MALTYLGLLCFIVIVEFARKKTVQVDFLSLGNLMFALAYVIPGFLLEANFNNSAAEMNYSHEFFLSNAQTISAVFIGYFCLVIGFYSRSAVNFGKNVFIRTSNNKLAIFYAIALLIFSGLAIYIYSAQYGGFANALINTTKIRSNAGVESGPLVFVKHFMYCSLFSSYLIAAFAFDRHSNKVTKFVLIFIFSFSVIVALTASILSGGRAIIIYYLLGFYLIYILKKKQTFHWSTVLIVCFGALFLLYGKEFFWSLSAIPQGVDAVLETFEKAKSIQASEQGFNVYKLMANFSFPIQSLNIAFENNYEYRYFIDWIYGFTSFIPQKVFNIVKEETISTINTRYYLGIQGNLNVEIPTGFLAFSIYSLSWPGLIIVSYFYGWIGRCLQTILIKHMNTVNWAIYLYILTAQVWTDYQQSGDPRVFLVANFWYIISTFVFLFIVNKIEYKNNRLSESGNNNHAL